MDLGPYVARVRAAPGREKASFGAMRVRVKPRTSTIADELGQLDEPVGVTPLVVVPAEHLDQTTTHHRERRIEHARGGRSDDVGGDEGLGAVVEHVCEWSTCGLGERCV